MANIMYMSSFQGEVCLLGSWEVHRQTFMSIYREWASPMGYKSQEKVPVHKSKRSVGLKEMYSGKWNLFNCFTKWREPEWGGALCSAKHSSIFREVTAGSVSKQWVWKPRFGVWVSVLDHKCLFWSQLCFKPSWENIFHMAGFQEVVCKPARAHHKKVTSKPDRSHSFAHHSASSYLHVYVGGSKQIGEVTKTMIIQCSDQVCLVVW